MGHLEKIVTSHSRLAGDPGGDDDHVTVLQGLSQLVVTSKPLHHIAVSLR